MDNGCIEHLLPFLHQEDWDVLIAHFLGVVWFVSLICAVMNTLGYFCFLDFGFFLAQDHAGHIFGVDSVQMIEKLEQYNSILQVNPQTYLWKLHIESILYWTFCFDGFLILVHLLIGLLLWVHVINYPVFVFVLKIEIE